MSGPPGSAASTAFRMSSRRGYSGVQQRCQQRRAGPDSHLLQHLGRRWRLRRQRRPCVLGACHAVAGLQRQCCGLRLSTGRRGISAGAWLGPRPGARGPAPNHPGAGRRASPQAGGRPGTIPGRSCRWPSGTALPDRVPAGTSAQPPDPTCSAVPCDWARRPPTDRTVTVSPMGRWAPCGGLSAVVGAAGVGRPLSKPSIPTYQEWPIAVRTGSAERPITPPRARSRPILIMW